MLALHLLESRAHRQQGAERALEWKLCSGRGTVSVPVGLLLACTYTYAICMYNSRYRYLYIMFVYMYWLVYVSVYGWPCMPWSSILCSTYYGETLYGTSTYMYVGFSV